MKAKKINNQNKEEKFRLASGVFLAMFFGTILASIYNFTEVENFTLGWVLLVPALLFITVSITSYYKPKISTFIGLILYVIIVGWMSISFPEIVFYGTGKGKIFGIFVLGLFLIVSALTEAYRKK